MVNLGLVGRSRHASLTSDVLYLPGAIGTHHRAAVLGRVLRLGSVLLAWREVLHTPATWRPLDFRPPVLGSSFFRGSALSIRGLTAIGIRIWLRLEESDYGVTCRSKARPHYLRIGLIRIAGTW